MMFCIAKHGAISGNHGSHKSGLKSKASHAPLRGGTPYRGRDSQMVDGVDAIRNGINRSVDPRSTAGVGDRRYT